jgi:putative hemolysin
MTSNSSRGEARPSPLSRFWSGSTAMVRRGLGIRPSTEEEIRLLLQEGRQAGVFGDAEHEMVKRVFRLGDLRASELMTPMRSVVWLDVADSPEEMQHKIAQSPHSRFPVCEESIDSVLGIVQIKDLLIQSFSGQPFGIKGLLKMPLFLYEGTPILNVLESFQKTGTHIALVLDEYGSVRGLLTLTDILEAIVGELPAGDDPDEPKAVRRQDGSWLLDGLLTPDEFQELFGIAPLPEGDYQTLAGFVIAQLGRIPTAADRFEWGGFAFEVMDMDGHRVDKVLVTPRAEPER